MERVDRRRCRLAPVGGPASPGSGSSPAPRARRPPTRSIAADAATCADCLAELRDPGDRRYRYPFINCTNCGPRFTIVRGVPYDRPLTTMAAFAMCDDCRREYEDPGDRRFHAQPNACPACGPQVRLLDGAAEAWRFRPTTAAEIAKLRLAIRSRRSPRGCARARSRRSRGSAAITWSATRANERAVAALRARKHREDKPFALMVADVASARRTGGA